MTYRLLALASVLALAPTLAFAQQTIDGTTRRTNGLAGQRYERPVQRSRDIQDLDRMLRLREGQALRSQRILKPATGQTSRPANAGRNVVRTQ